MKHLKRMRRKIKVMSILNKIVEKTVERKLEKIIAPIRQQVEDALQKIDLELKTTQGELKKEMSDLRVEVAAHIHNSRTEKIKLAAKVTQLEDFREAFIGNLKDLRDTIVTWKWK